MNLKTTSHLLPHQQDAVAKLIGTRIGALFMEMGTGKSRTAIELVLQRQSCITNCVWFCPVALKETVAAEIEKHTNTTKDQISIFRGHKKQATAFWNIIGIESMSSSRRTVFTVNALIRPDSFVIVDESSYIKGPHSSRTTRITNISERARYRLILTGTPLSQGVVDLFSQMRFLSPKILGYTSFYSFAANHLEYSDKYPGMIVRSHNLDFLAAKIKPYVYQVTKAECLNLPSKLYQSYYFSMTDEQRRAYERAKNELLADIPDDKITSWTIFRLFTVLQSIVCGFWNKHLDNGVVTECYQHGRVEQLLDIIEKIPENEKIIIWAKYIHDIDAISQALQGRYGNACCSLFTGKQDEQERSVSISCFRKDVRFFIATPSSGGHGLTLNEAHYVLFYNNGFKYSERLQAEDRCHRIGQTYPVTYIDIVCSGTIDDRIVQALSKKENVVKDFKRKVDGIKDFGMKKKLLSSL